MKPDCKKFELQIVELAYGELPDHLADELKKHMEKCESCKKFMSQTLKIREHASQIPQFSPSPKTDEIILTAAQKNASDFSNQHSGKVVSIWKFKKSFFLSKGFSTALAASIVIILSYFIFINPGSRSTSRFEEKDVTSPLADENKSDLPETKSIPETAKSHDPGMQLKRLKPGFENLNAETASPQLASKDKANIKRRSYSHSHSFKKSKKRESTFGAYESGQEVKKQRRTAPKFEKKESNFDQMGMTDAPGVDDDKSDTRQFAPPPPPSKKSRGKTITDSYEQPPPAPAGMADSSDLGGGAGISNLESDEGSYERYVESEEKSHEKSDAEITIEKTVKYFNMGRCTLAKAYYNKFLRNYPNHPKRPNMLMMAARCEEKLGNKTRANSLYKELLNYPGWAEKAKKARGDY